ncbi:RNA polymerase sigma factor, partial [Parabacteroides sp. OttesenSCG-928-B22]|nr:RNA polymerase sigma factor [Parabacteroides sp. OttesenSCG-928-B22]
GYRYDEISDIMNIPMGTVKSRIFVARQRLQNELKEFYYN